MAWGFFGTLTPPATVLRAAALASKGSGYRDATGRSPAPPVPVDTSPGRRQGNCTLQGERRSYDVEGRKIEVIQVRGSETTSPSSAKRFPNATDERPDLRRRDRRGLITHSQVSRQGGAARVEGVRCRRIDAKLTGTCPVTTNDPEARPTKPLGGKPAGRILIEPYQKRSHSRLQNPPSRQATRIVPDTVRCGHLGRARPEKRRESDRPRRRSVQSPSIQIKASGPDPAANEEAHAGSYPANPSPR